MASIFSIFRQDHPFSAKPYVIIETIVTSDGVRSRICNGRWANYDEAWEEKQKKELGPEPSKG